MEWLAIGGIAALLLLAGVMLYRRQFPFSQNMAKEAVDLLAEIEAEEFKTSVQAKRAQVEREISEKQIETEPAPEPEIDWQEESDVFRPTSIEPGAFVRLLQLPSPPEFKPHQHKIFISSAAYEKLRAHLAGDTTVELGGLLVGEAFYAPALDAYLLVVRDSLAAGGGVETATSFEYTAETWKQMTPQLQQLPPNWTVVGSYHSHPGLGVFLSTTDINTQVDVFSQDWQIALVVDPIADKIGFFIGQKGVPCPAWSLVDLSPAESESKA